MLSGIKNIIYKNNSNININSVKLFKKKHNTEKRKEESTRIREKYPDRIPVIVEKSCSFLPDLDKTKYLVPMNLTVGQFVLVVRKRLTLDPSVGIFLFFNNNIMANCSKLISDCYHEYKDEDGFLYIKYSGENTFG